MYMVSGLSKQQEFDLGHVSKKGISSNAKWLQLNDLHNTVISNNVSLIVSTCNACILDVDSPNIQLLHLCTCLSLPGMAFLSRYLSARLLFLPY